MRVVLLPGMDGIGLLFKPLLDKLPNDIEAEVVSYPINKKLSYEQLAEYVIKKLPKRGDYILVAESFSGPIAFLIAQKPPANLKSVIFVATFLHSPRRFLNVITWLPITIFFYLPIPNFIIKGVLFDKEVKDEVTLLFKESLRKVSKSVLAFRFRAIANLSLSAKRVNLPCVYIQATNDKLVSPKNLKAFKEIIQDINVVSISGPHFILQANPKACTEVIANECRLMK